MTKRYGVMGGDYPVPRFRSLTPGTETMPGPFEDEMKPRTEWTRLSCCPEKSRVCTIRYSIATEAVL